MVGRDGRWTTKDERRRTTDKGRRGAPRHQRHYRDELLGSLAEAACLAGSDDGYGDAKGFGEGCLMSLPVWIHLTQNRLSECPFAISPTKPARGDPQSKVPAIAGIVSIMAARP